MNKNQIQIIVEGHVQGVGFRFFTYKKATQLKLTGYVQNLMNGNVEIVAAGTQIQLAQLIDWLKQGGPRSAHIKNFSIKEVAQVETFKTFNVRS